MPIKPPTEKTVPDVSVIIRTRKDITTPVVRGVMDLSLERPKDTSDEEAFRRMPDIHRRMAFYAGLYNPPSKSFACSREKLLMWQSKIEEAVEKEYGRIDRGELPRRLDLKEVLGECGASPSYTEPFMSSRPFSSPLLSSKSNDLTNPPPSSEALLAAIGRLDGAPPVE